MRRTALSFPSLKDEVELPTLLGIALGILMSLAVEALIGPHVSVRAKATISLVVFFSVAYAVRRYLTRLRRGGG